MLRILVVDDEDDIVEVLRVGLPVFLDRPVEVRTAGTAEQAVQALQQQAFDVVLTDERMPGAQGTDLLAWVARHQPGVLRILMTAYADEATRRRLASDPDVQGFLPKPFELAEVGRVILALQQAAA